MATAQLPLRPPLRSSRGNHVRRNIMNGLVTVLALGATALVILPLIRIFLYLLAKGFHRSHGHSSRSFPSRSA